MTPPCILLDLDGTLIDSRPGILACLDHALRSLGHAPDPSVDLTWAIGPPLEEVADAILAPYGDDRGAEFARRYRERYGEVGWLDCAMYPGIPETLDAFAEAGWALCLATAKRVDFARRILAHLGLDARFRSIDGATGAGIADEKPQLIGRIVAREAITGAVMVGDRRHDVVGAHANRIPAIGALWGYGGRAELEQAGADALAATPAAVPELARRLLGG